MDRSTSLRNDRILGRSRAVTAAGVAIAPLLFAIVTYDLYAGYSPFGGSLTIWGLAAVAVLLGAAFAFLNGGAVVSLALVLGVALPHYIEACSFGLLGVQPSPTAMCPIPLAYPFSIVNGIPIAVLVTAVVGTGSYLLGRGVDRASQLFASPQ